MTLLAFIEEVESDPVRCYGFEDDAFVTEEDIHETRMAAYTERFGKEDNFFSNMTPLCLIMTCSDRRCVNPYHISFLYQGS